MSEPISPPPSLPPQERPIIFSAAMVRAILAGRKTMTRRLAWRYVNDAKGGSLDGHDSATWPSVEHPNGQRKLASPWQRVRPPDLLWVRESLRVVSAGIEYAADGTLIAETEAEWSDRAADLWNRRAHDDGPDLHPTGIPSIHMPRWASRITLRVTAVKVERLQDISREDAIAEGVEGGCGPGYDFALHAFMRLWNKLHGENAWKANPEVVAISFTVPPQGVPRER
jgi:hypothetical protein